MNQGAKQYKQMSVTTASRGRILIMLYETAVRSVKKAIECIERSDVPGKGTAIGKAHDIVNELLNTLDFKAGGNIATELERLYNFVITQLVKANMDNDKEALKSCVAVLENLLEGWRGAVSQVEANSKEGQKA